MQLDGWKINQGDITNKIRKKRIFTLKLHIGNSDA